MDTSLTCDQCGTALTAGTEGCPGCLFLGAVDDGKAADIPPGERRYQHYEILRRPDGSPWELGRGAMGVTYKARDTNLHVPVALKVIGADYSARPEARARFLREARAAARLRHPNVASVFHFGTSEPDTPGGGGEECFYAMEFVEGETLAQRIRHAGPLAPDLALAAAGQVVRALAAAERRGLVHRDLKPGNLMLTAGAEPGSSTAGGEGEAWVKVIDFGLAKSVGIAGEELDPETAATRHGGFLGTPQFASPEQFAGEAVDARSDIFSLGVTLWYCLTGELPFDGPSLAEIHDRQRHRPLPLAQLADAGVPAPVQALLETMLAADPTRRPASASALGEALTRCCAALMPIPAPAPPPPRAVKPAPTRATRAVAAKGIAVLPLESFSPDRDDVAFADGLQDDLLASLARIRTLRVIGRSSVRQYAPGEGRDLRAIGPALGVRYLVEGSVRRAGERVLVNVSLTDTRNGRQLWAQRYDRTLSDTITLQGELATDIARELRATLTPGERERVNARPTGNVDAYVLYLRARELHTRPTMLLQDFEAAIGMYRRAIALDAGFALARAHLSQALSYLFLDVQPTEANKADARAEADEALRLQPDLGEGHLARVLYLYFVEKNFGEALRQLDLAAPLLPNNLDVELVRGRIYRRQGRLREALLHFQRASALDGHSTVAAREVGITATNLRDWPLSVESWERTMELMPDVPIFHIWRAYVDFWQRGDIGRMRAAAASLPTNLDPDGAVSYLRWDAALLARDFDAATRAVEGCPLEPLPPPCMGPPLEKSYLHASIALARGDTARAMELFEAARPGMEAEVQAHPLNASRHAGLGLLYAYLGRKEDALRAGRRGVELMPESRSAYDGAVIASFLALIYARVGETDLALDLIERLLRQPGPVQWYDASITRADLRLRWQWEPLRALPRFDRIVHGPEPITVY